MLRVHFLNVGHGDCTIIKHPSGRLTVVDINNSQQFDAETFAEELAEETKRIAGGSLLAQSHNSLLMAIPVNDRLERAAVEARAKKELTDPVAFIKKNYPNEQVWRFILTHPDLDHMRGIKALAEHIGINAFWDTDHTKPTPSFRGDADKDDWEFYQTLRGRGVGGGVRQYTSG
jgi:hypothetical protein